MGYVNLSVAKPSEKDMDECYRFLRIMESLTDDRLFHSSSASDWKEWNKEDEDYELLNYCRNQLIQDGEDDEDELDDRLVLWEYVKWFFNRCPSSFARVLMCAQMALDNAFDEKSNTIEWKPEIAKAMEEYNEKHTEQKQQDNEKSTDERTDAQSD